MEMHVQK